jgi:hypothetical protein
VAGPLFRSDTPDLYRADLSRSDGGWHGGREGEGGMAR